jgi:hypothetical protein
MHYAGVVGMGFSDRELLDYATLGEAMASAPLPLLAAGERPDRAIRWIRPDFGGVAARREKPLDARMSRKTKPLPIPVAA